MTRQIIPIGNSPNDHKGEPLRTAFGKINDNFQELYEQLDLNSQLDVANVASLSNIARSAYDQANTAVDSIPFRITLPAYDHASFTFDTLGQVNTAFYYVGGANGNVVYSVEMAYDSNNNLANVKYHSGNISGNVISSLYFEYDNLFNITSITKS